jgi:hypothetical protein
MTVRTQTFRALFLSLLLFAVALSGFVAAGLAKGEAETQPAIAQPGIAAPQARTVPVSWLGHSGRLRAVIDTPDSLEARLLADSVEVAALQPGLHDLGIVTPDGDKFIVVSLMPYEQKEGKRLNGYYVGNWPQAKAGRYAPPAGFIEVTRQNEGTPVSQSFKLQDFLTHDQQGVWPKFLVLKPRLLDKLELISAALAERGLPSRLHVMSGFRTPQYNEQGVGAKGGRAGLSRHMYGDASDVFVDEDADGMMDDLNGDGKSTLADARVLFAVAEGVEAANPDLVGGLSPYRSNGVHGPFVHVDTRGVKARW